MGSVTGYNIPITRSLRDQPEPAKFHAEYFDRSDLERDENQIPELEKTVSHPQQSCLRLSAIDWLSQSCRNHVMS